MRDYLVLGPTPCEESCAQVGTSDYAEKSRIEIRVYIAQLLRQFGEPAGLNFFKEKRFPHEFGSYHEVVITYDDEDEASVDFAYNVENNLPAKWDEHAQLELRATNYYMSVVNRDRKTDMEGLMAVEPAEEYRTPQHAS